MLCAERWLNWSCLHVWTRNQTVPDDYLHLYKVHVASTMRILIVNMEILLKLQCWSSIQGPLCTAFVWNHLSIIATIRQKDLKKIVRPFCFCKGALLLHCKGTFSFKEPKLLGLWEPRRGWSWGEVEFRGWCCVYLAPPDQILERQLFWRSLCSLLSRHALCPRNCGDKWFFCSHKQETLDDYKMLTQQRWVVIDF